jgi:hypothetical protein
MKVWLVGLVVALAVALGAGQRAAAEGPHDEQFRATIGSQLEAFQRDDWAGAYAHASPKIQRIFPSPQAFGRMVTQGYKMIWRPSSVEYQGSTETRQGWVQTVRFVDQKGRAYLADYLMVEVDGVWRINGVSLRKPDDIGV